MINLLLRTDRPRFRVNVTARVWIPVKTREVAARYFKTNAVTAKEDKAGGPQVQFDLNSPRPICLSQNSITYVVRSAIGIDVD